MSKFVTLLIVVFLVACIVVLGICVAFMFNEGQNPFKQDNTENDVSSLSAVIDNENTSISILSSDVMLYGSTTTGYIGSFDDTEYLYYSYTFDTYTYYFAPQSQVEQKCELIFTNIADSSDVITVVLFDGVPHSFTIALADYASEGLIDYFVTYRLVVKLTDADSRIRTNTLYNCCIEIVSTELPETPTKTGYTFTGWYTDPECTQLYEEDMVTSDITLYAGWRANIYNVVFNANGGTGEVVKQSFSYDEIKKLQDVTYEKQFYKLIGWSTSEDGEVVFNLQEAVSNLSANDGDTIQLYAVWERVLYLVTFIVDGNTYAKVEIEAGTNIADVLNNNFLAVLFYISDDELEGLPDTLTDDVTINLQKTFLGNIVTQDWFLPVAISVGVLFVTGIVSAIVLKRKGGV